MQHAIRIWWWSTAGLSCRRREHLSVSAIGNDTLICADCCLLLSKYCFCGTLSSSFPNEIRLEHGKVPWFCLHVQLALSKQTWKGRVVPLPPQQLRSSVTRLQGKLKVKAQSCAIYTTWSGWVTGLLLSALHLLDFLCEYYREPLKICMEETITGRSEWEMSIKSPGRYSTWINIQPFLKLKNNALLESIFRTEFHELQRRENTLWEFQWSGMWRVVRSSLLWDVAS